MRTEGRALLFILRCGHGGGFSLAVGCWLGSAVRLVQSCDLPAIGDVVKAVDSSHNHAVAIDERGDIHDDDDARAIGPFNVNFCVMYA